MKTKNPKSQEKKILRMFAGEMSDAEIAFALEISINELVNMQKRIFSKLGVDNKKSAVEVAINLGFVKTNL